MPAADAIPHQQGDAFPAAAKPAMLLALRHAVRRIEGRGFVQRGIDRVVERAADAGLSADGGERLALAVAAVDAALGGGLARAALHEIAARDETQMAAASGFTLALAGRSAAKRAVLWIVEDMGQMESGGLYGPGLEEFGLAPEQLILVSVAHAREVLWAMEEALRCPGVGAVVGEIRTPGAVGQVAGRRLSLATLRQGTPALLLRARPDARPLAAMTRWSIGTARAAPPPLHNTGVPVHGTGPPAFAVDLTRNQSGRVGSWVLEWNRDEQRFELASAHSQSVAAAAADRPGADRAPPAARKRTRLGGVM